MKFKVKADKMDLLVILMLALIFTSLTMYIPNHNFLSYLLGMAYPPIVYLTISFFRNKGRS